MSAVPCICPACRGALRLLRSARVESEAIAIASEPARVYMHPATASRGGDPALDEVAARRSAAWLVGPDRVELVSCASV